VTSELPPTLVIGDFTLPDNAIVDGDTLRVVGLDHTLRLLGIDTEETFKHKKERDAFAAGWDTYLTGQRGSSPRPVKMATPLGEEGKQFAARFFSGVASVRLERDDPTEIRDRYGRYLAYVLVERQGTRVNYNVEAVRAGMTPYFVKYGASRRFDAEFVAAQDEARAAKRGIWDPTKQHYPDYDERLAWWQARARFVAAFWREAQGRPEYVILTQADAGQRLRALVGREAVVLSTVQRLDDKKDGPLLVGLATGAKQDFELVLRDRAVAAAAHLADFEGEFIRARGVITLYHRAKQDSDEPEMAIESAAQLVGSIASPRPAQAETSALPSDDPSAAPGAD